MAAITYIEHDGTEHIVELDDDMNLMEGATLNMIPGIEGVCGGICSCATCHCYIPDEWVDKIPPADKGEALMLEGAPHRKPNSRLGCQIQISEELNGMRVQLPLDQG